MQRKKKFKKLTHRQMSLMFSLRRRTVRNIKCNFPKMYSSLLCPLCKAHEDTQEHVLLCNVLYNILPLSSDIDYAHMRGTTEQQTYIDCTSVLEISQHPRRVAGMFRPWLYAGPVLPRAASGQASQSDAASTRIISPAVAVLGQ